MSLNDEQRQIERAVFEVVFELHPEHLTIPELVLKIAVDPDQPEPEEIRRAIRDLKRSGLFRDDDGVVAPTHAAVSVAALYT